MTHTKTLHEASQNAILLSTAKTGGTAVKKGQTTPVVAQSGYPLSGCFFLLLVSTSHCK